MIVRAGAVVLDGRPLAQELGVHADAKVLAGRLARRFSGSGRQAFDHAGSTVLRMQTT